MARIHFALEGLEYWHRLEWEAMLARLDSQSDAALCDAAGTADIIIDPLDREREPGAFSRMRAPDPRRIVWHSQDHPRGFAKGLYCSLPQSSFDPRAHRTFAYPITYNELIDLFPASDCTHDWLFFGGITAKVRERIVSVLSPVADATGGRIVVQGAPWDRMFDRSGVEPKQQYADAMRAARFIVCPRGNGAGSIRLFETLKAGRVPIIVADSYVVPDGLEAARCMLRCRESEVAQIPALVAAHRDRWAEMAAKARAFWEDTYSDSALLRTIVGLSQGLEPPSPVGQLARATLTNGVSDAKVLVGRSLARLRR